MNRLQNKFQNLKQAGKKGLITYIMGGDPGIDETEKIIYELESSGADIIELGIPFTDPLADGPVIEKAATRARKNSYRTKDFFNLVEKVRVNTQIPIVYMLYYNLIFKYGIDKFVKDCVNSGVDGLIIPDLPPEEAKNLLNACKNTNIDVIFLVAPTSTPERVKMITNLSTGFIYYVALTGITGASINSMDDVKSRIADIQKHTQTPVAVGFGVKTDKDAAILSETADAVIVGTALVNVIDEFGNSKDLYNKVGSFVKNMKSAMENAGGKSV